MKWLLFIFLLGFLTVFSNCSANNLNIFSPQIIQSEAKFNNITPQNIKITESKINLPTKEVLTEIIFFDKQSFVFIGNDFDEEKNRILTFFKTTDGGKTWKSNPISIPEDSGISQIFFINPLFGWMVLNNNGMGWWESKQTWLMKTTDGGKSWNITKTAYKTIYQKIFFFDENNGWMIGNEYSLEPTVTVKPLVYKTADGGDNWTETSEQLRNLMGIHDGNGHIGNLLIENRKKLKVTNKYKIFESNDEGKSWHNYGIDFSFLRDQNAIGNLGKIEQTNRIKAAQGGLTVEGSYVYLATEETDGTWINREIKEPINLSNVIFFTDKDAFLFGTRLEGSLQEDRDNMKGVIYYSSDGGATFSKIYETQKTLGFSDIHKITDKKFFVIGAEGLVLNIEF